MTRRRRPSPAPPKIPSSAPAAPSPLALDGAQYDRQPTAEGEPTMRPAPRQPTPSQARARRELAQKLIAAGATRELLRDAIRDRFVERAPDDRDPVGRTREMVEAAIAELGGPLSDAQIDYLFEAVARERAERFEGDRALARSAQAERLQRDVFRMRAAPRVPWHNVARHEELLGRVLGTTTPIKSEPDPALHLRESLLAVVGAMSVEEQERLVAEQAELELIAAREGVGRA